ncbi:MAG: SMP-30/gluconolactonase/LRE family protein [Anaerolineae bacterium]|nr:SMP-30/gluconolactonase/LRE family protein [Anaerolineae bacterium]
MATTVNEPIYDRETSLDQAITRPFAITWEIAIYLVIFALAVFTRFHMLDVRAMSHDESLHTYYSYELYTDGRFIHTPLMHGPILFHATAFFYSMFGDSDYSARIYTALLGVFMVFSPLLFRRWIGKWGALLACIMVLISPLLLYYNRYIREDTPAIASSILMIWAIFMYLNGPENQRRRAHWLYILSAALLWNLGSKETAFMYVAFIGTFMLVYWFIRLAQYFWNVPGRIWMQFITMGVLIAGFAAFGMYIVLDITPLERVVSLVNATPNFRDLLNNVEVRSFVVWSILVLIVVLASVLIPLFWVFRHRFTRLPWREVLVLFAIVTAVLTVLIIVEELSHIRAQSSTIPAAQAVPGEEGTGAAGGGIRTIAVIAPWVIMVVVLIGLFESRRRDWWKHLSRFPELDVMIVIGALILPWLTAVFIIAAGGTAQDFIAIGQSVPSFLSASLPLSGTQQTGQIVVGFLTFIPMFVIATATGLTWNWQRFLVCSLIFHAIFAFFFTTMFTNIQGLATGMVYSLQYWMEQQAERRGGQPQYYYLLIILPMYEYLPIIGSGLAMIAGTLVFWRRRLRNLELNEQVRSALIAETETNPPSNSEASVSANLALHEQRHMEFMPVLLFIAWWAVFITIFLTLAGEKMPWLGTHMAYPMILLTGWFFGGLFAKIQWAQILNRGWIYLLLLPLLLVALFQVIAQPLGGQPPFSGQSLEQIRWTNNWILSLVILAGSGFFIYRLIGQTSLKQFRHMIALTLFAVLSLITFRAAWMASFINYDLATEFLVYAHATNGTKIMNNKLEELSLRTTNGYHLVFAYDDKMSWPGVWYFRHYVNDRFMGSNPTLQQMEEAAVVVVGEGNRSTVEPLLEDRYQRFEFGRMWWPMMDYFDLNATRIINTFDLTPTNEQAADIRRGLFDIWWNRDYSTYGDALGKDFSLPNWPVQEKMYMYVRRDIAAQVWQFGTGDFEGSVIAEPEEISLCVSNWIDLPITLTLDTTTAGMNLPIGMSVAPNGTLYVAEDGNDRLARFDTQTGAFLGAFGQSGTALQQGAFFERPNGVTIGPDGRIVVADTWNFLIRVFDVEGQLITSWGSVSMIGSEAPAQPFDGFWGPRDVALDSAGNVYVADTGNKRIRVYTADGQWLRDIGRGGSAPGQLDEPSGIVISPDNRLFVADTWNRRIAVFSTDGTFITNYPVRAWYEVLGNRPYLALDSARNLLYITDPDAGRILVINPNNGECIGAFGRQNRENPTGAQFSALGGITLDAEGNVYVADVTTGRILQFPPFPVEEVMVTEEVLTIEIPMVESSAEVSLEMLPTEEIAPTAEITPEMTPEATPDVTPEARP